jgi:hypothetical protein
MYLLDTPLERGQTLALVSLEHIRLLVWKFRITIRNDALILVTIVNMTTSSTCDDF